MNKLMTSALVVSLTAGVSMGALIGWDGGAGTTAWNDQANWVGDVVPGAADNAMQNSTINDATVVISSDVTVGVLAMGNGGTGNANMHLILTNGASLVSTGWVDVARNKTGGTLTMYDSSIQTTGAGAGLMVGRPQTGVPMNGTVVLNNSTIDLFANLTMFDNQAALAGVTASVTLNDGSWLSTVGIGAVDNGKIYINSGSYLKIRSTSADAQIDTLIGYGTFVVDGTTVTALNKATYVYEDASNTYVIPEPATIGMLGLGAMGVLAVRRIRRRA